MACPDGTVAVAFDRANPQAVQWARDRAGQLITDVSADAKRAVREVIRQSVADGIPPLEAAKLIRAIVGLTERDALAVARWQTELMADGKSPAEAQRMAEGYAAELHHARAETIARTETMAAANHGQQALWNQALRQRLLNATQNKTWIVADPCEECAAMEDEEVSIDDEFSCGSNPPLHPNCRCTIGLVNADITAAVTPLMTTIVDGLKRLLAKPTTITVTPTPVILPPAKARKLIYDDRGFPIGSEEVDAC